MHTHTQEETPSCNIRGHTEACLWGDVAAVTLPLNKRGTSSSVTLKNSRPHVTYTHMQPQIMKLCSPTDCTQPTLSLLLAVRVSPPSFSPSLSRTHMEIQSTSLWEPDDKRDVGWGRGVRERNVSGCHCQVPTVPPNAPLSRSHTQTHTLGECFLCSPLSHKPCAQKCRDKCVINVCVLFSTCEWIPRV